MFIIALSIIVSFTITYFFIPAIIYISERKKLFDVPDSRKVHTTPIPSLGGFGIFAGLILATLTLANFSGSPEFQYIIASALIIFFVGLKDDILIITPLKKLIGQIAATLLIILQVKNLTILDMHGFLGVGELGMVPGFLLTFFTFIVVINAFNLIDGVNGLAGSLGLMTSVVMGFYFSQVGETSYSILAFSMAGSLLAFLRYNFNPAKIFMGDTGSLLVGLVSAILVIKFINTAPTNTKWALESSPALGFSVLIVPLLDTLRVFSMRLKNGRSPFSPDRNHIHHILLDIGLSHKKVTLSLLALNILFIWFAYAAQSLGTTPLILSFTTLFFLIVGGLNFLRFRQSPQVEKRAVPQPSIKVLINVAPSSVNRATVEKEAK